MKNKTRLCCFTVNYTHSCIISNNFIPNELNNVKVVYINEKSQKKKINNIISKFYTKMKDKTFFTEWMSEGITNDYENENFVFVVSGKENFINKVNQFLELNDFNGYIINCYEIFDISDSIDQIIESHDYYINTTGIVKKDSFRVI